jgi:hypothetical protein
MSNNGASVTTSGLPPPERTKFLHVVMSYDAAEGKYSYQTLDNPALRHQPCSRCDFDETLRAWQALPRSVKQAASRWVDENFSYRAWHLHAALPIQKDVRATRRFLQKAVLGAVANQGTASIMLVFSSTQRFDTAEMRSTSVAGDSVSESSHTHAPMSDGGVSRVELSQTDMEQMREWLTSRGLSTAKIAELESLVVKQKESAAAAAETQSSMPYDQSREDKEHTARELARETTRRQKAEAEGHYQTEATAQAEIRRQGSGSHVRFATADDVAPSTRHQSNATTVASRRSNTYDRVYAEPVFSQPVAYRTSRTHDSLRHGYRDSSPPLYFRRLNERAPKASEIPSDDEWYHYAPRSDSFRRVDNTDYRAESHQSAYGRRDPREPPRGPNPTRTEDEWEHRDRRPQTYRQDYDTTIIDPSSYENRDRGHGSRARSTGYAPTPIVNVHNEVLEDPSRDRFSPPSSSRPVHSNHRHSGGRGHQGGLADERAEELAEIRLEERRARSRSPGRHGTVETYQVSREYERSRGHGRSIDDGNARLEAEVRREASPRPLRTIQRERPMPAPQVRHEIFTKPYNDYGRRQSSYLGSTRIPRVVYPEILSIPRQLSPEPLLDDLSDAEDAALDDAELKNKMLVKYTGGTVANTPAGPDRTADKPQGLAEENNSKVAEENAADAGAEIDDEDARWDARRKTVRPEVTPGPALSTDEPASPDSQTSGPCIPTSPIPGVQVSLHRIAVMVGSY